ncbi:MAG TPA: DUF4382 domain-containing protein [Woeseiaceae bacterium]|nr:DUF4382 domain-containing protein [Woeseiaceae bacterium]
MKAIRSKTARTAVTTVLPTLILLVAALLHGCGGATSSAPTADTTPPVAEQGDLIITVTDAPGDFANYTVDVLQLSLQRANGDVVETLPFTTRIDFSELTEVSEFLTIATVPAGSYDAVVLTLDYSNAEIIVQDENGTEHTATAIDTNGAPLGIFDVRLELTTTDTIRIAAGRPAAFSLDFDLDASNEIDFSTAPPGVVVDAVLLATPELETDREHRARGVLADVNEADSEITLKVRPFHYRSGNFGRFTLAVDEQTRYEVDGVGLAGAEGLRAVAALAENTPIVAGGNVRGMSMLADTVLAGSSVPWADADVVRGVVTGRAGDTLEVRGARFEFRDGSRIYRGTGTVLLGPGTKVTGPGIDTPLTTQSISVGQRIVAFGELADAGSQDTKTLDVSDGRVSLRFNQLTAAVVDAEPLAVDLYWLNGRRPASFDFTGTGVDTMMDADPDYYEIDTGALTLDGLESGDLVKVRGLVSEFGSAPADFDSRTVIDVALDSRTAAFKAIWPEGTQLPFHSISATQIDVDLSAAREVLAVHGVPLEFLTPLANILLTAPDIRRGIYAVKVRGSDEIHLFRDFADLADELTRQLNDGASLRHIAAHGRYNAGSNELTSIRAGFVFTKANEAG